MFDVIIDLIFLLPWLLIFVGIIYVFGRFLPKGFIIVQVLFILLWEFLPFLDMNSLGELSYSEIPVFWFVSSLIYLSLSPKKKRY